MKIFGKRLTAGLLGAALVMSMPFAAALTQKNITVGRGVTVYAVSYTHLDVYKRQERDFPVFIVKA